jgi:ribonucleotide reductase beta subunit family protein with ferritin-like domain
MKKFEIFEKLTEKQLSFFWRPEEIDVTKDKIDFNKLLPNEKHIFISGFVQFPVKNPLSIYPFVAGAYP